MNKDLSQTMPMLVAIGASAGGLEALEELFDNCSDNNNMAFVVIQHLSSDYKSMMDELLSRHTNMMVTVVEDGQSILSDHVYLIPAGTILTLEDDCFKVTSKPVDRFFLPIDIFFSSMASNWSGQKVAIVLSGTGSDGSKGIVRVKESGGTIIVQSPQEAKFDGMPASALDADVADHVMHASKIGDLLEKVQRTRIAGPNRKAAYVPQVITPENAKTVIFSLLEAEFGINFAVYKQATVDRRIERRMHTEKWRSLEQYAQSLDINKDALYALRNELLIPVTQFFRDPAVFEFLQKNVVPELVTESIERQSEVRVWVPGCSTGDEAYSLAILFFEEFEKRNQPVSLKIFATDIGADFTEKASFGHYSKDIEEFVSSERLDSFFKKTDTGYSIVQAVRQCIVFANHNLQADAPFTRLDLVSCRNTLIYFSADAQKEILHRLQFALNIHGFLLLGSSESLNTGIESFNIVTEKLKVYQKVRKGEIPIFSPLTPHRSSFEHARTSRQRLSSFRRQTDYSSSLVETARKELTSKFVPPSILVSDNNKVVHTFGDIRKYWTVQEGSVSYEVSQTLISPLSAVVTTLVTRCAKSNEQEESQPIAWTDGEVSRTTRISVTPVTYEQKHFFLASFTLVDDLSQPSGFVPEVVVTVETNQRIITLEQELQATRESLQATIEELETTNEELQATNEELMASNEEMQSSNEELQSVNEELNTVNTEFQQKVGIMGRTNADLIGMSKAVGLATLFLDANLFITRFTPDTSKYFKIRDTDVGRPIDEIVHNLDYNSLEEDLRFTLETERLLEKEITSGEGDTLIMRILPYHVPSSLEKGVVVTFIDISALKYSQQLQVILDALPEHIAVLDGSGTICMVNQSWRNFAKANGDDELESTDVGMNYLEVCGASSIDSDAVAAARGVKSVLERSSPEFTMTYPCHSPDEERWFAMHVVAINHNKFSALVSHFNISAWIRKQGKLTDA